MLTTKRLLFWGSIIAFLLGFRFAMFLQDDGNPRALHPGSKLGLYEPSIESVSTEFLRRSPEFQAVYKEFEDCIWDYCDMGNPKRLAPILAKRDRIIQRDWPQVFDRLIIDGDWLSPKHPLTDSERNARRAHFRFQEALRQYGADTLRNHCVPIIAFRVDNYRTTYISLDRTVGYRCNPPPP